MTHLWFSFLTVLPLFLVMAVGFALRKGGMFTDAFTEKANAYLYYVALPAKLFLDVATADLERVLNPHFTLACAASICIGFAAAWLYSMVLPLSAGQRGVFIHGAFRGNFVYIGLALAESILQTSSITASAQVLLVMVPLYNIFAVLVLTVYGSGQKRSLGQLLCSFFKNPMLIAVMAALPFSVFSSPISEPIVQTLSQLGAPASPLALLLIGASFAPGTLAAQKGLVLAACLYKLLLQPMLTLPLFLFVLSCSREQLAVALVLMAAPSATNVYVMTKKMGGDLELGSGIVLVSEVLCIVSLTVWISLLTAMNRL